MIEWYEAYADYEDIAARLQAVVAARGTDSITGFRSGTDELNFNGVSVTGSTVQNGSTLLTLSDGTRVDLVGFSGGGFMKTNGVISHH